MDMCTAITYRTKDHYFGRNLDLDRGFEEQVVVTPRRCPLPFHHCGEMERHYAILGMAHLEREYPLYYDAVNEAGLAIAGLNFPVSAVYRRGNGGRDRIAPFELIPWLLGQCATVEEAEVLLSRMDLVGEDFSPELPRTPLHWLLADRERTLVIEPMEEGLKLWDDPVGVLANEPPFDKQMFRLNDFRHLSATQPENRFLPNLGLQTYSSGMGAMGLPGDLSSPSRFVRAVFARENARSGESEAESVSQFFHLLDFVAVPRGTVRLENGVCHITRYSACCNLDKGIYYYTTYENRQITAVDLRREDLEGSCPVAYPLVTGEQIIWQN